MWNCLVRPGRTRLVALLVAAGCAIGVLGACGGSDTTEPSQPAEAVAETVAAQTSTSSAPEEAAAAETGSAPEEAAGQGFELGFAYGLENTPIYQNVLGPAKVYAEELGVGLTLGSADSKCDKQLQDIENMIAAGVRAITFLGLCGEGGAYDKVVNEAHAKGVAVVSYAFEHPLADGSILFDDQGARSCSPRTRRRGSRRTSSLRTTTSRTRPCRARSRRLRSSSGPRSSSPPSRS